MKTPRFTGCGTALITPFLADGPIDEEALRALVERQIDAGIDFLVPVGTTGESPTLDHDEHHRVIEIVIEQAARRVPVIPGTGSNNTAEAIELTQFAKKAGADACLVVTPYYNKPTARGQIDYFTKVADLGLPVIVYNIPGRCAVNVGPETMAILMQHPNIIGVKEAAGLESARHDIRLCPEGTTYLSGDDVVTIPLMGLGGHGVISVVANLMPEETCGMVHAMQSRNTARAKELHEYMLAMFKGMFIETNPIPIKAAMAMMGWVQPVWRSPMTPPLLENAGEIEKIMRGYGLEPKHSAKIFG